MTTINDILNELNVDNLDDALAQIIKLKLGYQPWRDRRGELLSKPSLTDAETKLMPLGWRASFGHSHDNVRAIETIRKAAKLLEDKS